MENSVNINEYEYDLPAEKIAKFPLEVRDNSKLLIYDGQQISETLFNKLYEVIPKNSLLVFNNTKVIKARLYFYKQTGAQIEILCLEPYNPSNVEDAFQQNEFVDWVCMVGNLKKWRENKISTRIQQNKVKTTVYATLLKRLEDSVIVRFSWKNKDYTFKKILDLIGQTPIPPYLEREAVNADDERYQTVYSKYLGSVAAPTAGLHFTEELMYKLSEKNIKKVELTLHVGAGTFKPVKTNLITEHKMHSEYFTISKKALLEICEHSGPVIAVGTTSVRTLESLYISAIKLKYKKDFKNIEQWDGLEYKSEKPLNEVLKTLIQYMEENNLENFSSTTSLMIIPGFKFNVIDGLITNFHQPRSTLLMLIAAFTGKYWKEIYQYALKNNFRFLSYGDSSFLYKKNKKNKNEKK
jgi:S-adenosylmethionine:tRNA ribosyltransferase-isomerase